MTTPSSGIITMQDINYEIGELPSSQRSLNDSKIRFLTSKPSGSVSFSDAYNKTTGYRKYIGTFVAAIYYDIYIGTYTKLTNKSGRKIDSILTVKHDYDQNGRMDIMGYVDFTSGIKINNTILSIDYDTVINEQDNYHRYTINDAPMFVPGNSYDIFVG